MRVIRLLLLVAALVMVAACGDDAGEVASGPASEIPNRTPEFVGELTSVTDFEPVTEDCIDPSGADPDGAVSDADPPFCTGADNTSLGHVLVEEVPGLQEGDKISLHVDGSTAIFREGDDGPTPATFADLAEGVLVDAWVDGPVAESYPMQAKASVLLVKG